LVNEEVSELAAFSGLIITISCVIFFLVKYYIFEGFLLEHFYGDTYTKLHHVAATAKIVMLISAAYPFFSILAGASMHHSFAGSKVVTFGDGECAYCICGTMI
jgi:Na+-driven multidrug efflux pump